MRLIVLLLLVHMLDAHAQSCGAIRLKGEDRTLRVRHWDMEDGLSDRLVNDVAMDPRGFVWVATGAGIDRFDGYAFRHFGRAQGLRNDHVHNLVVDASGLIWSWDLDGDLSFTRIDLIDPVRGTIEPFEQHFTGMYRFDPGLLSGCMGAGADSTLYFSSLQKPGSVIMYHPRRGFRELFLNAEGPIRLLDVTPDGHILFELSDAKNGTRMLQLVDRDGQAVGPPFPGPLGQLLFPVNDGGFFDANASLACVLAPHRFGFYQVDGAGTLHDLLPGVRVSWDVHPPVMEWPEGYVQFGTRLFDRAGRPVIDLGERYPGLAYAVMYYRERADRVWVASEFGLYQLTLSDDRFTTYLSDDPLTALIGMPCRGLLVSGDSLLVNAERDGLYVLDRHTGAIRSHRDPRSENIALVQGAHGERYFAHGHQLRVERNGTSREYNAPEKVWTVLPDIDGGVLIGGIDFLAWLDLSTGQLAPFAAAGAFPELCSSTHVVQLSRTHDGDIWACTNGGLYHFAGDDRANEHFSTTADSAFRLPTDRVHHVYEDAGGILWISTGGGGLVRLDRRTGKLRVIDRNSGLASNTIYAVYEDGHHIFWIPSDRGLIRYDRVTGGTFCYTTADGIAYDEFNRISHTRGPDSTLYFGGLNGITAFQPDHMHIQGAARSAPLVITRLLQQQGSERKLVDLTQGATVPERLAERPEDGTIDLSFALLSFDDPALITYDWMIEGVDAEWQHQGEPSLRIDRLPYGDHRLRVRARSANGVQAAQEIVLPIAVPRPWYLRPWSMMAIGVLLATAVIALFRLRLARARRLFAVRDRIAMDLHDEVGSTLSGINITATVARKRVLHDPVQAQELLADIDAHTTSTMEAMHDIVWAINSRYDDLDHLVTRMRQHAIGSCERSGYALRFSVDDRALKLKLDMVQRKNTYLIFKEAINNAMKYAGASSLLVEIAYDRVISLHVADNGRGFRLPCEEVVTMPGCNGLRNMQRRAAELRGTLKVRTAPGEGTSVRLTFRP